jgi:hypothetical protein
MNVSLDRAVGLASPDYLIMRWQNSLFALCSLTWSVAQEVEFKQWCGKYYQVGAPQPDTPPSGGFLYPEQSSTPLLDFQCTTASNLYLENDEANDQPMILLDANITSDVGSTCEWCRAE